MGTKDLCRLEVIQAVVGRRQCEAAVRQVRRWIKRYQEHGPAGLARRYRGRRPSPGCGAR